MGVALNPTLSRLLGLCRLERRWVRGDGVWLFDETGRWFLDGYAQYGAVVLGHNAPVAVAALREALDTKAPAMVQPYRAAHADALADELVALAPGNLQHCVFTTSGSEAVEAAVKMVRVGSGRPLIVTARGGYHGKSLGTLALHPESSHAQGFGPLDAGSRQVPWGDAEALGDLLEREGSHVAGVLLEPIQGEGGVQLPPPGYLQKVRRLCDQHGVALILDEVQTGLGRTGTLFACEAEGVVPDVLTLAKALSGGLVPLGACLATPQVWSERFGLGHSSTFANNNLACAVGRAVLRTLVDQELSAGAARKGAWLLDQLSALARRHPRLIAEVRGRGLLTAIELRLPDAERSAFMGLLANHGLYAYAVAGTLARCASLLVLPTLGGRPVLRIAPPLTISDGELELLVAGLSGLFAALEREGLRLLMGALGDAPTAIASPPPGGLSSPALSTPAPSSPAQPNPATSSPAPSSPAQAPPATRVALPRPRPQRRFDYAFVAHLTQPEDLLLTNPGLELPSGGLEAMVEFLSQLPPALLCEAPRLTSPSGASVDGAVILLPLVPEGLRRLGARAACERVQAGVELAVSLGAAVVGLGGHTTPFSRHGLAVAGCGARVTTGNALTAGAALAAVEARLARRGESLADLRSPVAVLGAGGSVGGLCARLAARAGARHLLLIGNPASGLGRLERLRDRLSQPGRTVEVSNDLLRLGEASVVFAATASRGGALDGVALAPGALVCDLARPADASPALHARRDLELFEGGLMHLPDPNASFGAGNLVGLPPGVQLACLVETVLLALEGRTVSGRVGPDHVGRELPLGQVDTVIALAAKHGFRPVLGAEPQILEQPFPQPHATAVAS